MKIGGSKGTILKVAPNSPPGIGEGGGVVDSGKSLIGSCLSTVETVEAEILAVKGKRSGLGTRMWLKIIRQNIAQLARRAKGINI